MNKIRAGLLIAALALVGMILPTSSATAVTLAENDNPQLAGPVTAAAAPYQCLQFNQQTADHHLVRKTHNRPRTYTASGWFNVDCGNAIFYVPRGQQALVDLSATAELDCSGPVGSSGWCEGRFLVNGSTVLVHPRNDDLGDSYAWDSAKGGVSDWSAHALDQEYAVFCPRADNITTPCSFKVQLQAQLTAGATSLWLDDLTIRIDANYGRTTVTSVSP